jgi:hypothetical protein
METNQSDAGDMLARILDIAEMLVRRHGLEKLNVVDVALARLRNIRRRYRQNV